MLLLLLAARAAAMCETSDKPIACVSELSGLSGRWSVSGASTGALACDLSGESTFYFTNQTIHSCTKGCIVDNCNCKPPCAFSTLPTQCGASAVMCTQCKGRLDPKHCSCSCPFSRFEAIILAHIALVFVSVFLLS
jgi:hypothetical protein